MTVAQQIDLPIRPRPARPAADVPLDVVLRQPSRLAVIRLQISSAGLTDDQVAAELNVDAAQWSRIMRVWDLHQAGFDPASLRPLRSALERQLEEERARNADLQREMEIMQRYIRLSAGRG